jgi:hypothetical protein
MNTSKENFLKSAVIVAEDRFGLTISLEKMTEIIGDKMAREWNSFEYTEVSPYMDTAPREEIADIIAMHYTGNYWPTYGDNIDPKEFWKNLVEKVKLDS